MNLIKTFEEAIREDLQEISVNLRKGSAEIAAYMAARAEHLSRNSAAPDFAEMVKTERNNVALFAGINASEQVNLFHQRVFGLVQGALHMGAVFLAEVAQDLDPGEEP